MVTALNIFLSFFAGVSDEARAYWCSNEEFYH